MAEIHRKKPQLKVAEVTGALEGQGPLLPPSTGWDQLSLQLCTTKDALLQLLETVVLFCEQ